VGARKIPPEHRVGIGSQFVRAPEIVGGFLEIAMVEKPPSALS
jgi:hypothetical protein